MDSVVPEVMDVEAWHVFPYGAVRVGVLQLGNPAELVYEVVAIVWA